MAHHVKDMIRTHPSTTRFDQDALEACIHACFDCAQSCTACADACLAEEMVTELRVCIRLNLDCADVCEMTGRVLSRWGEERIQTSVLEPCRQACRLCAEECERHADMHEHCRVCAEACRECEEACDPLLAA